VESLSWLKWIVNADRKGRLKTQTKRLGNGALFSGPSGLAYEFVMQFGTVGEVELDTGLVEDFVSFSTVFFLFATRHGLGEVDNLVLGGLLGINDKSWRAWIVIFQRNSFADEGIELPFLVGVVCNRDVLSDSCADSCLEVKL
jgi:hypothetical protein